MERVPNPLSRSFSNATVITGVDGKWIFIAGQVGMDASGKVTTTDPAMEAELCFEHIRTILGQCNASFANVVRITAYLTSLANYQAYDKVRTSAFAGEPPASTSVQVAGLLANATLEIDAIAFLPASA